MNWLGELLLENSTAHAVLLLGLVITLGIVLGKIRFFGVSFGIAGVLFAGIVAATGSDAPLAVVGANFEGVAMGLGLVVFAAAAAVLYRAARHASR